MQQVQNEKRKRVETSWKVIEESFSHPLLHPKVFVFCFSSLFPFQSPKLFPCPVISCSSGDRKCFFVLSFWRRNERTTKVPNLSNSTNIVNKKQQKRTTLKLKNHSYVCVSLLFVFLWILVLFLPSYHCPHRCRYQSARPWASPVPPPPRAMGRLALIDPAFHSSLYIYIYKYIYINNIVCISTIWLYNIIIYHYIVVLSLDGSWWWCDC